MRSRLSLSPGLLSQYIIGLHGTTAPECPTFLASHVDMPLHLDPPCRAEHIGSFLRPAELVAKRAEYENHRCNHEELRIVEDESIPGIVRLQQEVGIKSITDGEMRR